MIDTFATFGLSSIVGGLGGVVGAVIVQEVTDTGSNIISEEVSEKWTAFDVRQSDAFDTGDTVEFKGEGVTGEFRGVVDDKIAVEVDDGTEYLPLSAYGEAFHVTDTSTDE